MFWYNYLIILTALVGAFALGYKRGSSSWKKRFHLDIKKRLLFQFIDSLKDFFASSDEPRSFGYIQKSLEIFLYNVLRNDKIGYPELSDHYQKDVIDLLYNEENKKAITEFLLSRYIEPDLDYLYTFLIKRAIDIYVEIMEAMKKNKTGCLGSCLFKYAELFNLRRELRKALKL